LRHAEPSRPILSHGITRVAFALLMAIAAALALALVTAGLALVR
jgi:hypothetical protein